MIDFVEVGNKIAQQRKAHKLSQEELADQLYITRQALSKWENGTSIPSIDSLLELCKIFEISFEEMLCLEKDIEVDPDNLFVGHERSFIIEQIIKKKIKVNIPDVLYQMSPAERLVILKAIKEDKLEVDTEELICKLTKSEMRYLTGGNVYEIAKSDN
jgi:transcriptional regulator with XRE-family HTH domain